jgi:predicted DNA-binding transcriptional regulator YafY
MRRADRLFQIIQILRRARGPLTAQAVATELEVSKRTVYRDIADLMAQRTPIQGEAGVGYVLDRDFDMPPLMLTPDELEAAALGAQWVAGKGDADLAAAARDLLAKIAAVTPKRLRAHLLEPSVEAAPPLASQDKRQDNGLDLAGLRAAIRGGRKVRLTYRDEAGAESERTIWPVIIGYVESALLLAAWCELREGFRHFRADRIVAAEFDETHYPARPAELRARWRAHWEAQRRAQSAGKNSAIVRSSPGGSRRSAPS